MPTKSRTKRSAPVRSRPKPKAKAPKAKAKSKAKPQPKPNTTPKTTTSATTKTAAKKPKPKTKTKTKTKTKLKTTPKPKTNAKSPSNKAPSKRQRPAQHRRAAASKPRTRTAARAPGWLDDLRAAVEATGPDFASFLTGVGLTGFGESPPWEYADQPELIGLELWGTELAQRDRRAAIGALVRIAQHGLPIAVEHGGIGIEGMGFTASEPTADGAPVETQITHAAAWLDAPDRPHLEAVSASIDRTRQLQIWDDDLIPNDDRAHWWYLEVGQCITHAITRTRGVPSAHSYYDWPPEVCVGRGLVIAVRGLRYTRDSIGRVLARVRDALVA